VLNALPGPLSGADREVVEAQLVAAATLTDPARLARFGTAVLDRVDPDGALRDYHYAHAHRHLTVTPHRGRAGGTIRGELSVELLEKFQTIFDALAKPTPTNQDSGAAIPDDRDPGARRHDAVRDAFDIALNGDQLPASGGTPATVVIHLSAEQYQTQTGLAVTDHGNQIPVPDALTMADNAAIYTLLTTSTGVPLKLARTTRIATPGQTIALAARDRGCTAPGCDRPPAWCQRHHILDWLHGGHTDLANLTLLCGYHHREFARRGWQITMHDGHPWWTPPQWIDPHQTPIRNHAHHHHPDTG
jgi:Domain of unknown function (DUF222)